MCTMLFDEETAHFDCEWSPQMPTKELLPQILKEYEPWRNEIIEAWAQRTGQHVLVVDL
jgi:hypothetical protein